MLKRKSFALPRERKTGKDKIALKRHENFPQAIHIFKKKKKNVNRLRKTNAFQMSVYFVDY